MKKFNLALLSEMAQTQGASVSETEMEYVFYAKVVDENMFESATRTEQQEQYQFNFSDDCVQGFVRQRVRRTVREFVETFEDTVKVGLPSKEGEPFRTQELRTTIDKNRFDLFKSVSKSGFYKVRYFFPTDVEGLVWEVDRFKKSDGSWSEYVKIDLEVRQALASLPQLPVGFSVLVKNQGASLTEEDIKIKNQLFESEFTLKTHV